MSYGLASLGLNVAAEEVQVFPSAAFSFSYGEASALVRPTITSANSAVSLSTTSSKAYKLTKSINNSSYSSASSNTYGVIYLTGLCNSVITTSLISVLPKSYLNSLGFIESFSYIEQKNICTKFSTGTVLAGSNTSSKPIGLFSSLGTLNTYSSIEVNPSRRIKVKGIRPAKAYSSVSALYQIWSFAFSKPKIFKALVTGTTYQVGRGRTTFRGYLKASASRIINLNEIGLSKSILKGIGASLRNSYQELEPTLVILGDGDRLSNGIRYVEFIGKSVSISLLVTGKLAVTPYTGILARSYLDATSNKIRNIFMQCKTSTVTYSESATIENIKTNVFINSVRVLEALPIHTKGVKAIATVNISTIANSNILSTKSYGRLNTSSIVNNLHIVKIKPIGFNLKLSIFAISTGEAIQSNASIMAYATSFSTALALPSINRYSSIPKSVLCTGLGLAIANIKHTKYFSSLNTSSNCSGIPLKIIFYIGDINCVSDCINTNYSVNNTSVFSNNLIGRVYNSADAIKLLNGVGVKLIKSNIHGYANDVNTKVYGCYINNSATISDKAEKVIYCYGSITILPNLDANPIQESTITYSDLCTTNATLSGICNRIYQELIEAYSCCNAVGDAINSTTKVDATLVCSASMLDAATKIINISSSITTYLNLTSNNVRIRNSYSYVYPRAALAAIIEIQFKQSLYLYFYAESNPLCKVNGYGNGLSISVLQGIGYKNYISKAPSYRTYLVDEAIRLIEIPHELRTLEI